MKETLAVALIFLASISGFSQDHYEECILIPGYWIDSNLQVNSSGEICISGTSRTTNTGGIIKLDKYGNKLWSDDFGGYAERFWMDDSGNVYVLTRELYPPSEIVYKLRKYFANGISAWAEPIAFDTDQTINNFKVDKQGNIYVVGSQIDPLTENEFLPDYDLYVSKYDAAGIFQWDENFADKVYGYGNPQIVVDQNGDIFIAAVLADLTTTEFLKLGVNGQFIWESFVSSDQLSGLYLDTSDNLFSFFNNYTDPSDFYKIDKNSGLITHRSIPLEYPEISFATGLVYFVGRTPLEMKVIGLNNDLSISLDLNLEGGTYLSNSLIVDPEGSLYVSGNNSNDDKLLTKYTNGQVDFQFFMPANSSSRVVFDFEQNLLTSDRLCLLKIYPCEGSQILITDQPVNTEVCQGAEAGFQIRATGKALSYQWYKGVDLLTGSGLIAGVNSNILTFKQASISDAGSYLCEVRDGCGHLVGSQAVTLSVISLPTISSQPQSISQCTGTNAIFEITATGGKNLKFQWKKGTTALVESSMLAGSKTNKLTVKGIGNGDIGEYSCEVTSDCFSSPLVSQQAVLTLLQSTAISNHPAPVEGCNGTSATFSVVAGGTNLTYQWRKAGINLVESVTAVGTKSSSLTIKQIKAEDAGSYSCVVSATCGNVTSNSAALFITATSQITQQPSSTELCTGGSATFSVAAAGETLVYRWKRGNTVLVDGEKYNGTNTSTLTISTATVAEQGPYTCTISSSCGDELVSNVAHLLIQSAPSITARSADLNVCEDALAKMSVTVSAGIHTYQWKKNGVILEDGNGIAGSKSRELFVLNAKASDEGNYTCEVSSGCGAVQVSGNIKLELANEVTISSQPLTQRNCNGDWISFEAAASGAILTYQWKKNGVNLVNGTSITGAQTSTLIIKEASVADVGLYSFEILSACGKILTSDGIKLEINPKPDLVLLEVSCEEFPSTWPSLVVDNNNVYGAYTLFKKGETAPLPDLRSATKPGIYIVVKNTSTCADSIEWNNPCLITGAEDELTDVEISPNPSSGVFHISHQMPSQQFKMYDSRGIEVLTDRLGENETLVDASHIANGIYYFTLTTKEGKRMSKRVMIQR